MSIEKKEQERPPVVHTNIQSQRVDDEKGLECRKTAGRIDLKTLIWYFPTQSDPGQKVYLQSADIPTQYQHDSRSQVCRLFKAEDRENVS